MGLLAVDAKFGVLPTDPNTDRLREDGEDKGDKGDKEDKEDKEDGGKKM